MLPSQYPEVAAYPRLRTVLSAQVDMQFWDLRTMLQLPRKDLGMEGGCNFAVVNGLFNIIGGASFLFFDADMVSMRSRSKSGDRFMAVLRQFYPWKAEPLPKKKGTSLLYEYARNSLVHALGMEVARPQDPIIQIAKNDQGLSLEDVMRLESADGRPGPTIYTYERHRPRDDRFIISAPALYWGTHQMLRKLFGAKRQASRAEDLAEELLALDERRETFRKTGAWPQSIVR